MPAKAKKAPAQKTLAERINTGGGRKAAISLPAPTDASPRTLVNDVLQNSKGVSFRMGDRVTVNGVGQPWVISSLEKAPMVNLLRNENEAYFVHVNTLRPVSKEGQASPRPTGPVRKSSPPVATVPEVVDEVEPAAEVAPSTEKRTVGRPWIQDGGVFSIVHIENGSAEDYLLESLGPDAFGSDIFEMTKLRAHAKACYRVRIGRVRACGCDGFRSHKHCKHVEALEAIRAQGRI